MNTTILSRWNRSFRNSRSRRVSRALSPSGLQDLTLERRSLADVAPEFFLNPSLASGLNQALCVSTVQPANGPGIAATNQDDVSGVGSSSASSTISNYWIYNAQELSNGTFAVLNAVTVSESGLDTISVALPVTNPTGGGGVAEVVFFANLANVDAVQTDANGPYQINGGPFTSGAGPNQYSAVQSSAPLNLFIANSDGSASNAAGQTVTATFASSMNAPDASGVQGGNRFPRVATLLYVTPYITVANVGTTNEFQVTQTGTGTVLATSAPNDPAFSYSGTFPEIAGPNAINYFSSLTSGPSGVFGGTGSAEYAAKIQTLSWTATLTVT
jgi:hypothetical protein